MFFILRGGAGTRNAIGPHSIASQASDPAIGSGGGDIWTSHIYGCGLGLVLAGRMPFGYITSPA